MDALQTIEQYPDREEKRDQFRKETIAAWNDYQATGLHVSLITRQSCSYLQSE